MVQKSHPAPTDVGMYKKPKRYLGISSLHQLVSSISEPSTVAVFYEWYLLPIGEPKATIETGDFIISKRKRRIPRNLQQDQLNGPLNLLGI